MSRGEGSMLRVEEIVTCSLQPRELRARDRADAQGRQQRPRRGDPWRHRGGRRAAAASSAIAALRPGCGFSS